ncbi:hypothetical protein ACIQU5_27950 [Streptomyces sp. NPDC090306]|uniref:hypothetical protein n=1 Tax=Streptomyces sp. NPDC090306 TaxID=3365961 RepID=UPI0037FEFABA
MSIRIPAGAVVTAPAVPTGPVDEQPEGYYATDAQVAALKKALSDAGVDAGSYDEVVVQWLARWDWAIVATIASWLHRAAARPAPQAPTAEPDAVPAEPITVHHVSRLSLQVTDAERFEELSPTVATPAPDTAEDGTP